MTPDYVGRPQMRDTLDKLQAHWPRVFATGFFGGLIAALGQSPFDAWFLTLAGLAIGAALVTSAPGWGRAAFGMWSLGLGYFGVTLVWIIQPFLVEPDVYGWMAPFALFFMAGGMALFWALGAGIAKALRPGRLLWLALAATLALGELLRGWIFTGFPWGGPGLIFIDLPFANYARVVGVYGLNALAFALGFAIWQGLERMRGRYIWAGAVGFLALGGLIMQRDAPPPRDKIVRLVQPNAAQHLKWDQDWIMVFFERAVALTKTEGSPDLVVWPETTLPAPLGRAPLLEGEVVGAAAPAPIVVGVQHTDGRAWFNSLALYQGNITPKWLYDKHHLVPFGEYVPLGNLASKVGIRGLAQRDGFGYAPGVGAEVLPLPDDLGNILPLICYEMIFPRDIRSAPSRADWILQSTNDAWFGRFSGPQQHLVQARFRAIEFGLPIARAANTGISAVIDANGQVVASLPLGEAGIVDAAIPRAFGPTVYAKLGDLPLLLAALTLLAALWVRRRGKAIDPLESGR